MAYAVYQHREPDKKDKYSAIIIPKISSIESARRGFMAYKRCVLVGVVLLLSFGLTVHGQEMKQETKTDATVQEVKPAAKLESAPSDTKQEVNQESKQDTQGDSAQNEKRAVARMDFDGVQRVEVVGSEYFFSPAHIVVKVNKPVEFKVKKGPNASWFIPHDMVMLAPEAGIDFIIDLKNNEQSVHFTPTKTGKYPFYCDKKPPFGGKSHRERGMEGVLEVVE
jgi:plastocyanin